jgi:hypothetical protein
VVEFVIRVSVVEYSGTVFLILQIKSSGRIRPASGEGENSTSQSRTSYTC